MSELRYVEATRGDIERIAAFHGFSHAGMLEHEFFSRPSDQSVLFMALDGEEVIGTQAFIAHEMNVNGRTMMTGRSERSLVSPRYRGQDVFVKLVEHCVRRGTEKGSQFFWGAATDATRAFKRAGFLSITGHRQYLVAAVGGRQYFSTILSGERLKALRPSSLIGAVRRRDRGEAIYYAQLALSPASAAFRLAGLVTKPSREAAGILEQPRSIDDINGLYARLRGRGSLMHLQHSASFHQWLLDEANHRTRWFFAYRAGELAAYVCLDIGDPVSSRIVDFAATDKPAFRLVLEEARAASREAGCAFMTAACNQRCPAQKALYATFAAAGFVPSLRGGRSVVQPGAYKDMNMLAEPGTWYMTDFWFMLYRDQGAATRF